MGVASTGQPTWLNTQNGEQDAPYEYTFPGGLIAEPITATATFDGSGAGGDFLACLTFYSQGGHILSRVFPQTVVTAGDTAKVSFAPFPGGLANPAPGGDGIKFDTLNVGDWLDVETTGVGPSGFAIRLATDPAPTADIHIDSGHDVLIDALAPISLRTPSNIDLLSQASGSIITIEQSNGSGEINITGDGTHSTAITVGRGVDDLAFYGRTPIPIQAAPVTLSDVIAVLHNLGLTL